jgi:hypothetical protein
LTEVETTVVAVSVTAGAGAAATLVSTPPVSLDCCLLQPSDIGSTSKMAIRARKLMEVS